MICNRWPIATFLLFTIVTVEFTDGRKSCGLLDNVMELFKSPIKWYEKVNVKDKSDLLAALAEQKSSLQFEKPILLEGSLVPVGEYLDKSLPSFLYSEQQILPRQANSFACSCNVVPGYGPTYVCSTTCTSEGTSCGLTCTNTRTFYATRYVRPYDAPLLSTTLIVDNCGCEKLFIVCSASSAIASSVSAAISSVSVAYASSCSAVVSSVSVSASLSASEAIRSASETVTSVVVGAAVLGAAAAVALGVGIGVPAIVRITEPVQFVDPEIGTVLEGPNFPGDGCGSNFVLFLNQNCIPLLRQGPCVSPFQWVTVNPQTFQGQCTPRLCGRERVFGGRDGLCHDTNDPSECQRGRRLYYSAFGDPICDCPIGQYPFPTESDNCVPLFTQGPCPSSTVVTFRDDDTLICSPSQCPSLNSPGGQPFQMVPFGNAGQCYALGTRGPCPVSHLLGYDVFQLDVVCVNMEDPSSPYFSSPEEDEIIDRFYNQPEFNDFQPLPFQQNSLRRNGTVQRRQGSGVFQLPSRFPDTLLNPCRPGDRNNFNYKCTNPLVPNYGIRDVQQPVRSPYTCQSNNFLQSTGQCSNDRRGANCGPSQRYNPITGQCRSIFS